MPFGRIAVAAPGLIGGSLCLALRDGPLAEAIVPISRSRESADKLRQMGFDQATSSLEEGVLEAGLCVLCCPAEAMESVGRRIASAAPEGCIVTDAASTKRTVVRQMTELFGSRFVGGHPMAGSEQSGLTAARADLFQGATCILTPTPLTSVQALEKVTTLWSSVGCRLVKMQAAEHDEFAAFFSHLPHAVASAVVHATCERNVAWQKYAGGGYRDVTRVAAGPSEMWAGIAMDNRDFLLEAVQDLASRLDNFGRALEMRDHDAIVQFFEEARRARSARNAP